MPAPTFRIVPAREVLGGVHALLRATALEGGVDLRLHVEPSDLELVADPDLLEQALLNLVLNALQAVEGRPDARVTVTGRTGFEPPI